MKRTVFVLIVLLIVTAFSGCSFYIYRNGDLYSYGNTEIEKTVNKLDVEWASGAVRVEYYDGTTVSVSETANKELTERTSLHYYLDENGTLNIKYAASGATGTLNLHKELTVLFPREYELAKLDIGTASADVTVNEISAREAEIGTSSGTIKAALSDVGEVELSSSSGKIEAELKNAREVGIETSSGTIKAELTDVDDAEVESSSGSITLTSHGKTENLDVDTTSGKTELTLDDVTKLNAESSSGDVRITLGTVPAKSEIDTSSGSVSIFFSENPDFTAEIDTSSGDFDCEIPTTRNGDTCVSGSGQNELKISTSSGDILFESK